MGYYVVTAVYSALVKLHGTDKLPKDLGVGTSTAALVGAAIFVCVLAPIAEEFFFRGFIFGALRRAARQGRAGATSGPGWRRSITGILFGLAHTGSAAAQYLIPLGFLGFVLCIVRWRTRSLYPCMALHSVNNSLALGVNQLHWNAERSSPCWSVPVRRASAGDRSAAPARAVTPPRHASCIAAQAGRRQRRSTRDPGCTRPPPATCAAANVPQSSSPT